MNLVFHIFLGLLLCRIFGINSLPEVFFGLLLAIFPDIDHLPHLKEAFKNGRFGTESRSTIHELTGITITIFAAGIINFIYPRLFLTAISCGLSHFAIDFLTRPFRPLYPFSKKEIHLHLYPQELRKIFTCDIILTTALVIIYATITLA